MSRNRAQTATHVEKTPWMQVPIAFIVLLLLSLYLRLRKFPALYSFIKSWPTRRVPILSSSANAQQVVSAVHLASVWLPIQTHCLVYSCTLVVLLRNHDIAANLVIGVCQRPFGGHAWVEIGGEILGPTTYTDLCLVLDRF